jgi:hypothetical protein
MYVYTKAYAEIRDVCNQGKIGAKEVVKLRDQTWVAMVAAPLVCLGSGNYS